MKRIFMTIACLLCCLVLEVSGQIVEMTEEARELGYDPEQLVIQLFDDVSPEIVEQFENEGVIWLDLEDDEKMAVLTLDQAQDNPVIADLLMRDDVVKYVEPVGYTKAAKVPNDTYFDWQWNFKGFGEGGINMIDAWDVIDPNEEVIIAVVDTGVAYEDYIDNSNPSDPVEYTQAPDLIGVNFVAGYDYINKDSHPNDDAGHGTHVTGTISQTTDNYYGISGIAFGCKIMPVKVLDAAGSGTDYQVYQGVKYAVNNGADVINLSLGIDVPSIWAKNAVKYAYEHGCVVVCASGNEALEGNPAAYPASYDDYCISVGATAKSRVRASYSCYNEHVDIVAPGGDFSVGTTVDDGILQQTFDMYDADNMVTDYTHFGFMLYTGTSMATPHVSGVAALLISAGVSDPDQVREALEQSAIDLGPAGCDDEYGWGLLNAYDALNYFPFGDINLDRKVDNQDFSLFATYWKLENFPARADMTHDGTVDELDVIVFAEDWLK